MSEREGDGGGSGRPEGSDRESEGTEGRRPAGDDPFEGLVLDEEFIRGAEQEEPSARARMLAERWKREPPEDTRFREAADGGSRRSRLRRRRDPGNGREARRRGRRFGRGGGGGAPAGRDRTDLKIAVWFVVIAVALLFVSSRGGF